MAQLYTLVGMRLVIAITQFIASLLENDSKEETTIAIEPCVSVMHRALRLHAVVLQDNLTAYVFRSPILVVSLPTGKKLCWPM